MGGWNGLVEAKEIATRILDESSDKFGLLTFGDQFSKSGILERKSVSEKGNCEFKTRMEKGECPNNY